MLKSDFEKATTNIAAPHFAGVAIENGVVVAQMGGVGGYLGDSRETNAVQPLTEKALEQYANQAIQGQQTGIDSFVHQQATDQFLHALDKVQEIKTAYGIPLETQPVQEQAPASLKPEMSSTANTMFY